MGVGDREPFWRYDLARTTAPTSPERGDFSSFSLIYRRPHRFRAEEPLRLSQYFVVLRAQERRALGPRGERRAEEKAAAREPGGPVRSVRLGWKTFFLITSPRRSFRVARRAGLVRLLRAGPPIFSCAMGGVGFRGWGTGARGSAKEANMPPDRGSRSGPGCQRGWNPLPSPLHPIQVGSKVGAGMSREPPPRSLGGPGSEHLL